MVEVSVSCSCLVKPTEVSEQQRHGCNVGCRVNRCFVPSAKVVAQALTVEPWVELETQIELLSQFFLKAVLQKNRWY
jgi:hypothetical protein